MRLVIALIIVLILVFGAGIYWFSKQWPKKVVPQASKSISKEEIELGKGGEAMKIKSSAFEENGIIPKKYTCDGEDVNPPLSFEDIPEETKSLALIVDDPDAPAKVWTHWVVFNIPPTTTEIGENSVPEGAIQGKNDFGKVEYGGPCPPPGPAHRYRFKIYGLDIELDLEEGASKQAVEQAMEGHILAQGILVGKYGR